MCRLRDAFAPWIASSTHNGASSLPRPPSYLCDASPCDASMPPHTQSPTPSLHVAAPARMHHRGVPPWCAGAHSSTVVLTMKLFMILVPLLLAATVASPATPWSADLAAMEKRCAAQLEAYAETFSKQLQDVRQCSGCTSPSPPPPSAPPPPPPKPPCANPIDFILVLDESGSRNGCSCLTSARECRYSMCVLRIEMCCRSATRRGGGAHEGKKRSATPPCRTRRGV